MSKPKLVGGLKSLEDLPGLDWSRITGKPVANVREVGRGEDGMSFESRPKVRYELSYANGQVEELALYLVLDKKDKVITAKVRYE